MNITQNVSAFAVSASFARIAMNAYKGETVYFTPNERPYADVQVSVLNSLRVRLARYHIIQDLAVSANDQTLLLYNPQGVEHSFSLRLHCTRSKSQNAAPLMIPPRELLPRFADGGLPQLVDSLQNVGGARGEFSDDDSESSFSSQ